MDKYQVLFDDPRPEVALLLNCYGTLETLKEAEDQRNQEDDEHDAELYSVCVKSMQTIESYLNEELRLRGVINEEK